MLLSGWGRYPSIDAKLHHPYSISNLSGIIECAKQENKECLVRGLGRSYGDASLAPQLISMLSLDHMLNFDEQTGLLCCQAGTSLAAILEVFVPKGWFLKVVPGTKYVTVGGAVASDVHGKNHHIDGSFCEHVESIVVLTANSGLIKCSRKEHQELFYATCGGMGLTGIIAEVTIKLTPIRSSEIEQTIHKAKDLEALLSLFEEHNNAQYSVAWIDCLSSGKDLGRSLLMLGEHRSDGKLFVPSKKNLAIPKHGCGHLLNRHTIKLFNAAYYHRVRSEHSVTQLDYDSYFFPLDALKNWPNLYGNKGFCQYQFVIPMSAGIEGIKAIMEQISQAKIGAFLAVLKLLGPQNDNYLSFPLAGYTLAIDFKMSSEVLKLLDTLDEIVLENRGRIYLTKDARMSKEVFRESYLNIEKFEKVREYYGACTIFNSLQSRRLGIS